MIRAGRFELHSVITGHLRLDGGSMFGVVPRVLWSRVTEPDAQNRIALATRTLVAVDRSTRRLVLVDTGCGTKWAPEHAARFAIAHDEHAIDRALEALGFARSDVTDVVVTHLHFDHNGGLTDWADAPEGATVLRYPSARHWIHRDHWSHAGRPHVKDRASFLPQDFESLERAGVLELVHGDTPDGPLDGWTWLVSHGHTPFQLHPVFRGEAGGVAFAGDLVPTRNHLSPAWVMAYDVQPMVTIDEKLALYRRCFTDSIGLAFPHDPECAGVRLGGDPQKPIALETLELDLSIAS